MDSQPVKAIVVDDEKPSREVLINYLREYCPEVEVVAECSSLKTGHKAIAEHHPRLVFLDIEMPRGSGFDLLRKYENHDFRVIFVTAYSQYAIRAFRCSATDYLMKPVKVSELIEAVNKAIRELSDKGYQQRMKALLENLTSGDTGNQSLVISDTRGFTILKTQEIYCCEADGYCTIFHLSGSKTVTSSKNLKHFEELLAGDHFMRVHNSFLVNLRHITGYTHQGEIFLPGNLKCPLSATYKTNFLEYFKNTKAGDHGKSFNKN